MLTCASTMVKYTVKQEDELNAGCDSVHRKLIGFNKRELGKIL